MQAAPRQTSPRRIYVTDEHEYHVIDGTCVEVRDVKTRRTQMGHTTVGSRVIGCIRLTKRGFELSRQVEPGARLCFACDYVSSTVSDVRTGD
jgi:hypothetical protein